MFIEVSHGPGKYKLSNTMICTNRARLKVPKALQGLVNRPMKHTCNNDSSNLFRSKWFRHSCDDSVMYTINRFEVGSFIVVP